MSIAEIETKIINLSGERYKLIKKIKSGKHPEHEKKYIRRIESINREIEELLQCNR